MKMLAYYVVETDPFHGDYEYVAGPFNGRVEAEDWIYNFDPTTEFTITFLKDFKIVRTKIEVE